MEHLFAVRDSAVGKEIFCAQCGSSFPVGASLAAKDKVCLGEPPSLPVTQQSHSIGMLYETDECVAFMCTICSKQVKFCKPGNGEPCVSGRPGAWTPPEHVEQWIGGCDAASA